MARSFIERVKKGAYPDRYPHFLEVKDGVDKEAQRELELRCKDLTPEQIEALGEEKGYAGCIYMRTPNTISLVWNHKTRVGVSSFAQQWHAAFGLPKDTKSAWEEYIGYLTLHGEREAQKMRSRAFRTVKSWVIQKRFQLATEIREKYGNEVGAELIEWLELAPFKPDSLGFFGGKIYEWEKFLYGPAYPLEAFAREAREEGGIHPLWSALVDATIESPTVSFEKWFFWVIEAVNISEEEKNSIASVRLAKEGVKGETDPPVEVEISHLNQRNFYWSHAQALLKHLRWLVEEAGQAEYANSYDTLRRNFGVSYRPRPVKVAPEKPIESPDASWEDVMKSVTRPRQLHV